MFICKIDATNDRKPMPFRVAPRSNENTRDENLRKLVDNWQLLLSGTSSGS